MKKITAYKELNGKYKSIGGWLAIFGLGLIFQLSKVLANISRLRKLFPLSSWHMLDDYLPGLKIFVAFLAVSLYIILAFVLVMIPAFYKRKSWFPRLAITYLQVLLVFSIVICLLYLNVEPANSQGFDELFSDLICQSFASFAWILYFYKSHRVKMTFMEL